MWEHHFVLDAGHMLDSGSDNTICSVQIGLTFSFSNHHHHHPHPFPPTQKKKLTLHKLTLY